MSRAPPHHLRGQTAAVAKSLDQPEGDYLFNSGDLILDLLHSFFVEVGERLSRGPGQSDPEVVQRSGRAHRSLGPNHRVTAAAEARFPGWQAAPVTLD